MAISVSSPAEEPSKDCADPSAGGPTATPSEDPAPAEAAPAPERPWLLRNKHDGEIARLALPSLATLILDPIMSLIDTAAVGSLGPAALAGTGLGTVTFSFASSMLVFLAIGTTQQVAKAFGDGQGDADARVSRSVGASVLFALLLGTATAGLVLATIAPTAAALTQDPVVYKYIVEYMSWRVAGLPFMTVQFVLSGSLRGLKDTITPFKASAVAAAVNFTGDMVMVYGLGLGVAGASFATSLSQMIGCLGLGWYLSKKGWLRWGEVFRRPTNEETAPLLSTGVSLSMRTVVTYSSIMLASQLAQQLGRASLAAHEVTRQVVFFLVVMQYGLSIAAQGLVASAAGRRDNALLASQSRRLVELSAVVSVSQMVLVWLLQYPIITCFTQDAAAIDAAVTAWPALALGLVFDGIGAVQEGVLLGSGEHRLVAYNTVASSLCGLGVTLGMFKLFPSLLSVWAGLRCISVGKSALSYMALNKKLRGAEVVPAR